MLQAREELLRVFVKNVPAAVAMLDRDMRYLQVSDRWCSDNNVEASQILGRPRDEAPEMPEHFKEANRRALQGETLRADEDRWESKGGTRWGRWEVRPWRNPDDSVGGILVFAEDITRRKQMEEMLSGMSRKLIEAQEQERSRIARELHDDIGQRLSLLAIKLDQLGRKELTPEVMADVNDLRMRTGEITRDLQGISHELHSSTLEYLGLGGAITSWCRECGERYNLKIEFKRQDVRKLPQDISLCLFRVLQEAVRNACKHSGAKRIEVQLTEKSDEIHLIVSDSGKGFDIEATREIRGLGLTSMQERVRLVGGTIAIESKDLAGTTIHVCVPFGAERDDQRQEIGKPGGFNGSTQH